jgi:hypothetical protein
VIAHYYERMELVLSLVTIMKEIGDEEPGHRF